MTLLNYLLRRLAGIVAVILGVSVITFAISHVIPADPVLAALGDKATQDQIVAFRTEYGLDKPLPVQYALYLDGLLHGDLGRSIRTRRPVLDDLRDFFPATVELALAALLVSLLIGIPTGIWSALKRNQMPDYLVRTFSIIGGALPIFWLGLILIGLFYYRLNWLPAGGRIDQFIAPPHAHHRTVYGG